MFSFLKIQVAERNKNQISGRAATRRSCLLRPVWQETKAVPRCNEGTSASQRCSLVYIHDTEANVLRHTDEQLSLSQGLQWESLRTAWFMTTMEGYFC